MSFLISWEQAKHWEGVFSKYLGGCVKIQSSGCILTAGTQGGGSGVTGATWHAGFQHSPAFHCSSSPTHRALVAHSLAQSPLNEEKVTPGHLLLYLAILLSIISHFWGYGTGRSGIQSCPLQQNRSLEYWPRYRWKSFSWQADLAPWWAGLTASPLPGVWVEEHKPRGKPQWCRIWVAGDRLRGGSEAERHKHSYQGGLKRPAVRSQEPGKSESGPRH